MYRYYLFDFDYTLVNSESGILGCFQRTLEHIGHDPVPDDAVRRTIGMPMPAAVGQVLQETDPQRISAFIDVYREFANTYMTPGTFFYPETLPMLRSLQAAGARAAVISSKTSHRIAEKFAVDNVSGLVEFIIGCNEVTELKPAPEGIQLAMQRFNAAPEEVLYIGDSIIDAGAAQNAQVAFAGVTTGATSEAELAAWPHIAILKDLSAIPTL